MRPKQENGGVKELLSFVTDKAMQLAKENAMLGEPIEKNGLTIIPVSQFSASFAGGGVDGASNTKQTPDSAAHQKYVTEICDRINASPEAKHVLSELATEYGYSATYLGKLFHKNVGISFSNYLLNARINYAKILLLNSKLSVGEIAEKLGYYDTAHFINQFKKTVGCTPNAYR